MTKRISKPRMIFFIMTTIFLAGCQLGAQMPKQQALTKTLECPQADCPLLRGVPETSGMRSGFVRLPPGQNVGWHSSGQNEEALVILHGKGATLIEGQPQRAFTAPALAYIPPATRHNVQNIGTETLEYVYVVAPAKP